jgi:hypothetical protein
VPGCDSVPWLRLTGAGHGHADGMSEEEELVEEARRSQEKTQELREESGLGRGEEPGPPAPDDPLPDAPRGEPWAKTSSGDADDITDD